MSYMNNVKDVIKFILPFSNEIANALTLSREGPFKRIYINCPYSWNEIGMKAFIDMMALSGIIWNVSFVSSKYSLNKGFIYGITLIILAFLIPNITMESFINIVCKDSKGSKDSKDNHILNLPKKKCNNHIKLLVGLLYIGFLFRLEYIASKIIIDYGKK